MKRKNVEETTTMGEGGEFTDCENGLSEPLP